VCRAKGADVSWRDRIVGVDESVPVLGGGRQPCLSLDNAASTPALKEVMDAVNGFMPWYASVHRGAGHKSQRSTQAYDDARDTVARFVGASLDEHTVIFGKNCTEAINKLSYRLPLGPDDVVLVSLLEHHSNDLPWRARARVVHIGADAQGRLDEVHFEHLLRTHAGRVRLVALTGGSNVTGHMPDVHGLAAKAHAAGAQILVDAAQLAPHRAIDMRSLGDPGHLDYLALSAHKLYAPFGTGALIGRRDTFEHGEPEHRGGGTIEFVSTDRVTWAAAPARDEAGSPNVVGAIALAAAVRALQGIGMAAIAAHEAELTAHALHRLSEVNGLRIYGDARPEGAARRLGVIPFNLITRSHFLVAAVLSAEHGIGVRNGCFCAHPYLMHLLGLTPTAVQSLREQIAQGDRRGMPGMVRVSFGLFNTTDDVDRLVDALQQIARGRMHGRYVQDRTSGECRLDGAGTEPGPAAATCTLHSMVHVAERTPIETTPLDIR
jgi:selenocysteine lyase/cysteine desulfurase